MKNRATLLAGIVSAACCAVLTASCAVTTRSFEGSTETFANTSDASSDFTSSTLPRGEDLSQAERVGAFAAANLDRLREEMARGGGEHLAAFSHLLRIREDRQADFFLLARERYPVVFGSGPVTSRELVARVNRELDAYPGWRQ